LSTLYMEFHGNGNKKSFVIIVEEFWNLYYYYFLLGSFLLVRTLMMCYKGIQIFFMMTCVFWDEDEGEAK
jgi:hypothetical protein